MASLATCVINVYSDIRRCSGVNCPPQRHVTSNQLKVGTKTSFSGTSSSPRLRCTVVTVLKYNLRMEMETLLPGLASRCLLLRRQAIHVDYVNVFPIPIIELSHSCVNDRGSDSVGEEEYFASVFMRSSLLYLSTVGIVQVLFAMEETLLTLHISRTSFLITPLLINFLSRGTGFQCHGSSQSLRRSGTGRRALGKDLFINL